MSNGTCNLMPIDDDVAGDRDCIDKNHSLPQWGIAGMLRSFLTRYVGREASVLALNNLFPSLM